ncbi:MAG: 23S rRNA (pseudouridine(1915)-N(3))-methyltransferase RlmH [Verrucomicrobiota bacterium]
MKWKIIVTGKPSLAFARDGVAEYEKRLRRYAPVEILYLKDAGSPGDVAKRYGDASDGCLTVALDERGETWSTEDFRDAVLDWEMDGTVKAVAVWIGGADGHGDELRDRADKVVSFGRMTLQHELALVVFLEQLYRVQTLKRGEPYHR